MKAIKLIVVVIIALCCVNCSTTDTNNSNNNNTPILSINVSPQFLPYYNSFIEEMQSRGLDFSTRSISVVGVDQLSTPNSGQYCAYGYPNFNGLGQARVEVISNYHCWDKRSETEKENLMYHEFGHALLNKNHFSAFMPNGSLKSLMCTEVCSNYRVYNIYQTEQRSYYLDELADPSTPIPNWATAKAFSSQLFQDNFDSSLEGWQTETITLNGNAQTDPYIYSINNASTFSAPNALKIATDVNSEINSAGNWYKTFSIDNFNYCSNIIVRTDVITENLTNGYFAVFVDLYDDTNTEVEFGKYYNIISSAEGISSNTYQDLEVNVTCLPLETTYIKVRFYLETLSATQVSIDNLEIELYQ